MGNLLLFLDVAPSPPQSVSWVVIAVLLGVILFLSVAFTGALVFFLIRFKRRQQVSADYADYADSPKE